MYLHMNAKEMSSIWTITASIPSFGTQMTAYLHIYVASVVKCQKKAYILVIVIWYVPYSQLSFPEPVPEVWEWN